MANRQYRTSYYQVRDYLRIRMNKRDEFTIEDYSDTIEHAMEMLYDFHVDEIERTGGDFLATVRTDAYKIYEYLRVNMYERVNGVRVKKENSVERLEEVIQEAMENLYILHRKEVENIGKDQRAPKNRAVVKNLVR